MALLCFGASRGQPIASYDAYCGNSKVDIPKGTSYVCFVSHDGVIVDAAQVSSSTRVYPNDETSFDQPDTSLDFVTDTFEVIVRPSAQKVDEGCVDYLIVPPGTADVNHDRSSLSGDAWYGWITTGSEL
ncbi:oligopeptidase [Pseudozyma hubeiensis SY62]|uniref:Oligopeptidase n=1 Tax=Pseudozyma hubeiensis (strain SY62) TaxID=1305764 RepID=R9PF47_PSEHS|nr:oligopeptidase [Pseudozyma hubeiensis SY62]GAC99842.1 oligopeptidase [Pseudozyma hubeiensis SY62]